MRLPLALFATLLVVALTGCTNDIAPKARCDLMPLATGNWWKWEDRGVLNISMSDTVGGSVTIGRNTYLPLHSEALALPILSVDALLRMDEACRLLFLDGEVEKTFIDFNAPVMEDQLVEISRPTGGSITYAVNIRTKRAYSSYPGGSSNNCYVVDIRSSEVTDAYHMLVFAPGIGLIRDLGYAGPYQFDLVLTDYHLEK